MDEDMVSNDEINHIIEYSLSQMYPSIEGLINILEKEGAYALQFPATDHWEFNRTAMTRLNEDNADETIKEVLAFYKKKKSTSISWVTGPLTTPSNFNKYLNDNDFEYHEEEWGMYLAIDKKLDVQPLEDIAIKEATLDDLSRDEVMNMMNQAYGMPEGSSNTMKKFVEMFSKITRMVVYIAYDGDKPVAFANLIEIPSTNGGLLGGAATLPEYRKRGIYSNMLKIRKTKAKEFGISYLIIQAKENTSAPIAKKHGFEHVGTLKFYKHNPKE